MKKQDLKVPDLKIITGQGQAKPVDRFELLFENAHDAIIVIDVKSRAIIRVNQAVLELTGYLREEIEEQPVSVLYPDTNLHPVSGRANPLSDIQIGGSGYFEDVMIQRKDGYLRYVEISVKNTMLSEGRKIIPVAMCILRDVTEKKTMERELVTKHTEMREAFIELEKKNAELKSMQEMLVQSGKLAALGELAAGIAHELNQPLTAVKGFAQEAKATLKTEYMDEVIKGADKMQKIISHLRGFTRKSTEDFQWCDVHAVLDESFVMLGKQLAGRGIEVLRQYARDLPRIYCNPFQLEQAFINFATNARDAIKANGKIEITTRKISDKVIEIKFKDNGCGMPDAVKSKIFNPFFTTKEVGQGMGLGLSISYGILERIHASIVVESTLGLGTTFKISLPVDYREH